MNAIVNPSTSWRDRFKASGIHLSASLVIAALAAALVFGVWYPYPYREISGGRELFVLLVSVDVVLGPLITFTVFNRRKSLAVLQRDFAVVIALQLGALAYGLWTVSAARPVHMVFEIDRFRVVHAVDVPVHLLDKTPSEISALPLSGPTLLAIRAFRDNSERMEATLAAVQGVQLGFRPDLWQPYADAIPEVLKAARPVSALKARFADRADDIDRVLAKVGAKPESTVYLPLVSRSFFWTVFLDPVTAQVLSAMPLDSF